MINTCYFILYSILSVLICISPQLVLADHNNIKEYGIAILPDPNCTKMAENLNMSIAKILSDLKNVKTIGM